MLDIIWNMNTTEIHNYANKTRYDINTNTEDIIWNTNTTDIHNYVDKTKTRRYDINTNTEVVVGVMYMSISLLSNIVDILELGKKSACINKTNNITGFLIYQSPYFCQYIEGDKIVVDTLLKQIFKDCRHVSMHITENCTYTNRKYPDWDMQVMIDNKRR